MGGDGKEVGDGDGGRFDDEVAGASLLMSLDEDSEVHGAGDAVMEGCEKLR